MVIVLLGLVAAAAANKFIKHGSYQQQPYGNNYGSYGYGYQPYQSYGGYGGYGGYDNYGYGNQYGGYQ